MQLVKEKMRFEGQHAWGESEGLGDMGKGSMK